MRYVIVTKNWESDSHEANSAEDALIEFAEMMNTDMSIYFDAIPEYELETYIQKRRLKEARELRMCFAKNVLLNDLNVEDEFERIDIAEMACDLYEDGWEGTEYECIVQAFDDYNAEKEA